MDGKDRVEEVRQSNTMRLRNEAKKMAITIEAPRAAMLHYLEARFVMAVKQLVGDTAGCPFVRELQSLGAKPLDADYSDCLLWKNTSDRSSRCEILKLGHFASFRN